MIFVSLSSIVKNVLLDRAYPMHFYVQFLNYAKNISQELIYDRLGAVNTVVLKLNAQGYAKLPDDYVDWTKVGVVQGQLIKPLVQQQGINRLPNTTSEIGGYIPTVQNYYTTYNDFGEYVGRDYGGKTFFQNDTYKIIKERGIIQCSEALPYTEIIMEYISNGCCMLASVGVEAYAQATIKSYILWQMKDHSRAYSDSQALVAKKEYTDQYKILRARLNEFDGNVIQRIMQLNYIATPK